MSFDYSAMQEKFKVQQKNSTTFRKDDDRFWKPAFDNKAPDSSFVVRFLHDSDGNAYKPHYRHWFKYVDFSGEQKIFDEFCPNVLGMDNKCPVCAKNSALWNTGFKEDEFLARTRTRAQKFITNVLIINDTKNPENNGKVKLWLFGKEIKTIYDKIMSEEKEEVSKVEGFDIAELRTFMPFHPIEGANFLLRITPRSNVDGKVMITYEKSLFAKENGYFIPDIAEKDIFKHYNENFISQTYNLEKYMTEISVPTYNEIVRRLPFLSNQTKAGSIPAQEKSVEQPPEIVQKTPQIPVDTKEAADNTKSVDAMLDKLGLEK